MIKFPALMLTAMAAAALFFTPSFAYADAKAECDAHAAHIDKEIGAKDAIEAYHVLHGDKKDDHHIIDKLKHDHPDIEHELEEFVKAGCSVKLLEAHANDGH